MPFDVFVLCFVLLDIEVSVLFPQTITVLILLLIGCVTGLQLFELCVFNDCFELKYELKNELEYHYYCHTLLRPTMDAASTTLSPPVIFDLNGVGSCETSGIGYSSISVLSPTTVAPAVPIKNENESATKTITNRITKH